MARKTLLTETQIRRFLKLANVGAIGAGRLEEMGYGNFAEQEGLEDEEVEVGMETDVDLGDDVAVDDVELGAEEEPVSDVSEASIEELVQALADTIADVTGVPVSVEGSVEGEEEIGAEDEVDVSDLGGEEEITLGAGEEVVDDELPPGNVDMGVYQEATQENLVAEVARRVASRLAQQAKKDRLAETLAERILSRLTK
jgi:hypothetical protein